MRGKKTFSGETDFESETEKTSTRRKGYVLDGCQSNLSKSLTAKMSSTLTKIMRRESVRGQLHGALSHVPIIMEFMVCFLSPKNRRGPNIMTAVRGLKKTVPGRMYKLP